MTAREVIKKLESHGWVLDRVRGSHHSFVKDGHRSVVVSVHGNKDLGIMAKQILKQAGIKD